MKKKDYTPLEALGIIILMLLGSAVCFLLCDKVFDVIPTLDWDVFFELLVVVFGCALFCGGLFLLGLCINILTNISKR